MLGETTVKDPKFKLWTRSYCDCPLTSVLCCQPVRSTCGLDATQLTHDNRPAVHSVGSPASFQLSFLILGLSTRDTCCNLTFHSHLQIRPFLVLHFPTLTLSVYVTQPPKTQHNHQSKVKNQCESSKCTHVWSFTFISLIPTTADQFSTTFCHPDSLMFQKCPGSGHRAQVNQF